MRHKRLQLNAMEHRYRLHEAFERAADQWHNQLTTFAKTGVYYVLYDL